jgi:hypothetical protein
MKYRCARQTAVIGLLLGVLTVVALAQSHREVGYVRDEGIYFEASRRYATWVDRVRNDPSAAMKPAVRDRHFALNHEHPALMKTIAGVTARALVGPDPAPGTGITEGAAMRLPAQVLAGCGVMLLFFVGARLGGIWAGFVCAGWFIALPRVWFHAGLHAFDVPVAVATLAVALVYRASLRDTRWGVALGPLLGVAIAIKHNAMFLGPLLALHYWGCLAVARWRHGRTIRRSQLIALPLVSMATLAPLTAWALWPWLWHEPWARLRDYFEFHRHHSWYNMEFLGHNFNQPPMPVAYPTVMTVATVPAVCLLLALVGLGLWVRADLRRTCSDTANEPSFFTPLPPGWDRLEGWGVAALAIFPIALISLPSTPIFGGTKHWLTAYPFMAIGAAFAWSCLWRESRWRLRRWLEPLAAALCLAPSIMATIDGHPYNLSQYAPLVGGPRGAANLGLNRGFWGHAALPLLPIASEVTPPRAGFYLHDIHPLAQKQYEREGRWPDDLVPAAIGGAAAGLLFHELHMTTWEVDLWKRMHTTAPAGVITLDDVPLTSLYAR